MSSSTTMQFHTDRVVRRALVSPDLDQREPATIEVWPGSASPCGRTTLDWRPPTTLVRSAERHQESSSTAGHLPSAIYATEKSDLQLYDLGRAGSDLRRRSHRRGHRTPRQPARSRTGSLRFDQAWLSLIDLPGFELNPAEPPPLISLSVECEPVPGVRHPTIRYRGSCSQPVPSSSLSRSELYPGSPRWIGPPMAAHTAVQFS